MNRSPEGNPTMQSVGEIAEGQNWLGRQVEKLAGKGRHLIAAVGLAAGLGAGLVIVANAESNGPVNPDPKAELKTDNNGIDAEPIVGPDCERDDCNASSTTTTEFVDKGTGSTPTTPKPTVPTTPTTPKPTTPTTPKPTVPTTPTTPKPKVPGKPRVPATPTTEATPSTQPPKQETPVNG